MKSSRIGPIDVSNVESRYEVLDSMVLQAHSPNWPSTNVLS